MIDSVLKGTGNSRFLKSAVPAGTSWADALAMLQAGTFPIDFNGINNEGFQQVGTPLNKANLLKDATAAQIGLPPSTTPDGMFNVLAHAGDLHVWRKTVTTSQEIPAGYTLGDAESGTAFSIPNAGSQNYVTLQYGPSITVNDGGGVSLTSVTGSIEFKQYSNVSAIYDIRNNFVKAIPNGTDTSAFDGVIFVPNDCSFKNTAGIVTFGKFYRVNAYPLTPAGTTTTYPVSTNRNAYQEGNDAKPAGYTLGEAVNGKFRVSSSYVQGTAYWKYGTSLTVSDEGTVNIADSSSVSLSGSSSSVASNAQQMAGKYAVCTSVSDTGYEPDFPIGTVVFFPSDTLFTRLDSSCWASKYQPVTGYAAIPANTTIEYLGCLGDKARVQVVSYVGTGTYGSDHPNSLTFDFVPKAVFLFSPETHKKCFVAYGDTEGYPYDDKPNGKLDVSWDKKKMSWFQYDSANNQLNLSNYKYRAIAIG